MIHHAILALLSILISMMCYVAKGISPMHICGMFSLPLGAIIERTAWQNRPKLEEAQIVTNLVYLYEPWVQQITL